PSMRRCATAVNARRRRWCSSTCTTGSPAGCARCVNSRASARSPCNQASRCGWTSCCHARSWRLPARTVVTAPNRAGSMRGSPLRRLVVNRPPSSCADRPDKATAGTGPAVGVRYASGCGSGAVRLSAFPGALHGQACAGPVQARFALAALPLLAQCVLGGGEFGGRVAAARAVAGFIGRSVVIVGVAFDVVGLAAVLLVPVARVRELLGRGASGDLIAGRRT